jgi:O-acetyl-ADP-ribose deacetylase (regulator of RNase III)
LPGARRLRLNVDGASTRARIGGFSKGCNSEARRRRSKKKFPVHILPHFCLRHPSASQTRQAVLSVAPFSGLEFPLVHHEEAEVAAQMEVVVGRIERLEIDAIVNPANRELLPGGGADGDIRQAAGPALDALLSQLGPLEDGAALITPGFNLPSRYVIHTAAPIWRVPGPDEEKIARLASCYRACIDEAVKAGVAAVAFPALGTGIYGWPKALATDIATKTVRDSVSTAMRVVFCCFTESDATLYRSTLTL